MKIFNFFHCHEAETEGSVYYMSTLVRIIVFPRPFKLPPSIIEWVFQIYQKNGWCTDTRD